MQRKNVFEFNAIQWSFYAFNFDSTEADMAIKWNWMTEKRRIYDKISGILRKIDYFS